MYVVNDETPPTDEKSTTAEIDTQHQEEVAYAKCLRKKILRDRNSFRKELSRNSLYVNENFKKPWKLVSR